MNPQQVGFRKGHSTNVLLYVKLPLVNHLYCECNNSSSPQLVLELALLYILIADDK